MAKSKKLILLNELETKASELGGKLDLTRGRMWLINKSGLLLSYDPSDDQDPIILTDYSKATGFNICQRDLQYMSSGNHDRYKFPLFHADIKTPYNSSLRVPIMHNSFEKDIPKMAFKRDYGTDVTYMAHSERCGEDSNTTTFSFDECLNFFYKKEVPKKVLNS